MGCKSAWTILIFDSEDYVGVVILKVKNLFSSNGTQLQAWKTVREEKTKIKDMQAH